MTPSWLSVASRTKVRCWPAGIASTFIGAVPAGPVTANLAWDCRSAPRSRSGISFLLRAEATAKESPSTRRTGPPVPPRWHSSVPLRRVFGESNTTRAPIAYRRRLWCQLDEDRPRCRPHLPGENLQSRRVQHPRPWIGGRRTNAATASEDMDRVRPLASSECVCEQLLRRRDQQNPLKREQRDDDARYVAMPHEHGLLPGTILTPGSSGTGAWPGSLDDGDVRVSSQRWPFPRLNACEDGADGYCRSAPDGRERHLGIQGLRQVLVADLLHPRL